MLVDFCNFWAEILENNDPYEQASSVGDYATVLWFVVRYWSDKNMTLFSVNFWDFWQDTSQIVSIHLRVNLHSLSSMIAPRRAGSKFRRIFDKNSNVTGSGYFYHPARWLESSLCERILQRHQLSSRPFRPIREPQRSPWHPNGSY